MSDWVIEAIRRVDPCRSKLPPPPMDAVVRRLEQGAVATDLPTPRRRPSRITTMSVVLSGGVATAVAVIAIALLGPAHRASPSAGRTGAAGSVLACRDETRYGVLPTWARAGFSPPRQQLHYVMGESGRVAAIPFGSLNSPPAANHSNKILWVSRVPVRYGDLKILAQRMSGTMRLGLPVNRSVVGGPGPSIIDLPSPGCWRLTLRWSGWTDHLDLQYSPSGRSAPSLVQGRSS